MSLNMVKFYISKNNGCMEYSHNHAILKQREDPQTKKSNHYK